MVYGRSLRIWSCRRQRRKRTRRVVAASASAAAEAGTRTGLRCHWDVFVAAVDDIVVFCFQNVCFWETTGFFGRSRLRPRIHDFWKNVQVGLRLTEEMNISLNVLGLAVCDSVVLLQQFPPVSYEFWWIWLQLESIVSRIHEFGLHSAPKRNAIRAYGDSFVAKRENQKRMNGFSLWIPGLMHDVAVVDNAEHADPEVSVN